MPVLKGQNGRVGGNETLNETGRRAGGRSESKGVLHVLQLAPDVPVKNRGEGLHTAAQDRLQPAGNSYLIVFPCSEVQ